MRQTEMHLTEKDRSVLDEIRSKGVHRAREVNRAHVLSSLDQGIAEAQITAVWAPARTCMNLAGFKLLAGAGWRQAS